MTLNSYEPLSSLFNDLSLRLLSDNEIIQICEAPCGIYAPMKSSSRILGANYRKIMEYKGWIAKWLSRRWGYTEPNRIYQLYSDDTRQIHFDLALLGLPDYQDCIKYSQDGVDPLFYGFDNISKEAMKSLYQDKGWAAVKLSSYFNFAAPTRIHQIARNPAGRAYYIDAFKCLPPYSSSLLQ